MDVPNLNVGSPAPFLGIRKHIRHSQLTDSAFTTLEPGKSIDFEQDFSSTHDLSPGGDLRIGSKGWIPYATVGSNLLRGSIEYESNTIEMAMDGDWAANRMKAVPHIKRAVQTELESDCSGSKRTASLRALSSCASLATAASQAASSGSAAT
jgi:deuterolysin